MCKSRECVMLPFDGASPLALKTWIETARRRKRSLVSSQEFPIHHQLLNSSAKLPPAEADDHQPPPVPVPSPNERDSRRGAATFRCLIRRVPVDAVWHDNGHRHPCTFGDKPRGPGSSLVTATAVIDPPESNRANQWEPTLPHLELEVVVSSECGSRRGSNEPPRHKSM